MVYEIKVSVDTEEIRAGIKQPFINSIVKKIKNDLEEEIEGRVKEHIRIFIASEWKRIEELAIRETCVHYFDRFLHQHTYWNMEEKELYPVVSRKIIESIDKAINDIPLEQKEDLFIKQIADKVASDFRWNKSKRDKLAEAIIQITQQNNIEEGQINGIKHN